MTRLRDAHSSANAFQQRLGLEFDDPGLLELALTHASVPNENEGDPLDSNERLEFLGDALVGLVVARSLFDRLPGESEGDLTVRRSLAIRTEALERVARELDLGRYLVLGRGEQTNGGAERSRTLASALEAVIGAVLLDKGNEEAMAFAERILANEIDIAANASRLKDPKSLLQEYMQARGSSLPEYRVIASSGPPDTPSWTVEVLCDGEVAAEGEGRRKLDAERQAANRALDLLDL